MGALFKQKQNSLLIGPTHGLPTGGLSEKSVTMED